ncbi:hypothetical protein GE107_20355 [Cohnella sp. CFH 77786]|uniref:Ig-like domain-containing protein n=1 Tax=Cohnella sp. CFH 77786 TaxID=2662265 RepID=UPI001C60DA2E|nr:Ig-like domain-containing protein [Cohnella sp. CFH 77786]MBW5448400.1 hypothetical protein [Cohnella sp. CFH 77786]
MNATFVPRPARRLYAALLVLLLLAQGPAGLAHAEDTVTGIQFDSSVPSPVPLYVEDGTYSLTLWANIQGSSTPKNVTADATWSSSSSSIKVDKGILSATGEVSTATITAKYKTFSATATVKAEYRYASLKLENADGGDAPDQLDIELGKSPSFNAYAYEYGGTKILSNSTAQWLTSNSSVASVSAGVVTLAGPGTATITAKLKGRADSIQLNVTSPYKSLDISHPGATDEIELQVGQGTDYTLTATATLKNANGTEPITTLADWTTSNANVVKVDKGVVTAVGAGRAIVTAKRFGVADAVTFYVRTPYEALNVATSKPLSMTLYGAGVEVSASAAKGTSTPVDVSLDAVWTVADPMVASVEKTGSKAIVKPKGVGTTKLTVSYKGLSKELPISVYPSVNALNIAKDKLDVYEGADGTLPAVKGTTVGGDEIDVSKLVSWKSSDPSVLSIEEGKWTAKKVGTATLTAEVQNEEGTAAKTDSITAVVHKQALTLLTDTPNLSVVTGRETDLPAVRLIYTDGEEKDVTQEIEWKSSSPNLFVKPGKIKGLLPAGATLTGTYLDKKVTVKVQVEEEFVSFDIQPNALSLTLNRSQTVKVTGTTKSGKKVSLGSRVSWTTESSSLVEIKGAAIKGLALGSGKLTASVQGKKLELPFTVKTKLTKLISSDTSLKLTVGKTDTVVLTAAYENGTSTDATKGAVWTSTNPKVATVANGTVKALAEGSASIKAVYEGKSVTIRVTVK